MIPVLVAGAALVGGYALFSSGKGKKLTRDQADEIIDSVGPINLEEGLIDLECDSEVFDYEES